jgi:uncharacterized membrane protein YfcA
MSPLQNIVFAIACLMIGLSKGGLGGPLPVVLITPILATVLGAKQAVGLPIPFLIFADWFALRLYWRKWDSQQIRLMMPAGIIGAIIGGLFLAQVSDSDVTLKIIIGVFAAIVLIYKLIESRFKSIQYEHRDWHAYLAASLSAFGSVIANAGAPPFTIYLILQKLDPVSFIGTVTLFFTVINLMKVPVFIYNGNLNLWQFLSVLWALPIVPLGVWLGRKAVAIIEQKTFERIMLVLLLLSIMMLFVKL